MTNLIQNHTERYEKSYWKYAILFSKPAIVHSCYDLKRHPGKSTLEFFEPEIPYCSWCEEEAPAILKLARKLEIDD